jgi:NAD(P)-dependent dehydrogenase (short-subunit alcohol dehydrogenase family)
MTNANRIFITGGASGLGRAIAERYLDAGWRVLIGDLNAERGRETVDALADRGQIEFRELDVRDETSFAEARQWIEQHWGGLEVLVNNAGVAAAGRVERLEEADWRWILDINLMGVIHGCRVFTPLFKRQESGHFVNIASMAGLLNPPMMSSYNVSKAGVVALSETLRYELSPWNIHTTVVCPGFFQTNLTESLRSPEPGMAATVGKLLATSDLSAADIAGMIHDAVARKTFILLPHRAGRRARRIQRFLPPLFRRQMQRMAANYRHKLDGADGSG